MTAHARPFAERASAYDEGRLRRLDPRRAPRVLFAQRMTVCITEITGLTGERRRDESPLQMRVPWGTKSLRVALVLRVAQVVVLALAIQVSGAAHVVADLVFHDDGAAQCGDGGGGAGDDDRDCPPGCPTCHACAHAQVPYAPAAPALGVAPVVTVTQRVHVGHCSLPRGEPPFVYRPPRPTPSLAA